MSAILYGARLLLQNQRCGLQIKKIWFVANVQQRCKGRDEVPHIQRFFVQTMKKTQFAAQVRARAGDDGMY